MGKGTQIFSWIHEGDVARAIEFLYNNKEATDVFNVVSPNAVTNKFLMQTLRQKLGISFGFPTPEWLLKFGAIVIGTETELILKSRWVYPAKLLESGFTYKYDTIANACEELIQ